MKKTCVLLVQLFLLTSLSAQIFERLHAPVTVDDTPLLSPWAGGVNAPQWSEVDLDGDGTMDLYAFDRNGHVHLPFRNVGTPGQVRYEFAPEFLPNFPRTKDYVLLRDYNQDGVMDLFAHAGDEGIAGMKVYTGYYENGNLKFDRVEMSHFGPDVLTIPINGGTSYTNLNVSRPDYPAIDDVDGDGDLDIIGVNSVTGSTFIFYKNQAIEQGFTLDTLIFKTEDNCWMKIFIPSVTDSLNLSCSPTLCADDCLTTPKPVDDRSGGIHGAGALLTFDQNNDGLKELLYGDLQYPNVMLAKNGGSSGTDWATSQVVHFPSNSMPVDMANFPGSFMFDLDNDGIKDYLSSPNSSGTTIRDRDNVWYYRNVGSNELPVFEFQQQNLFFGDMIDLGTGAQPAFFDQNGDGLLDMLVGNFTYWTPSSQPNESFLHLYRNVGTATEPAFELVDINYLNFRQYSLLSPPDVPTAFAPTFGDMDGDGDMDLLVGTQPGTLFYVENTAGPGNPVTWGPVQPNWKGIDVGQNATPCIYDVNADGLPDLVIGEQQGTVNFLPNMGTPGSPSFDTDLSQTATVNNIFFGKISTQNASQTGTQTGFSSPVILPLGDTTYIVTGSELGTVEVYILNPDSLGAGSFEVVSENFGNLREGTFTRLAFANLNGDDFVDAVIGNNRGGLGLFTSPFPVDGGIIIDAVGETQRSLEFQIFPNPTDGRLHLRLPDLALDGVQRQQLQFRLFSPLGQALRSGELMGHQPSIELGDLPAGLYLLEVRAGGMAGVKKVVVK